MLKITRRSVQFSESENQQSWPLMVTCEKSPVDSSLDPEIFVYHAKNNADASPDDLFVAVASIHQMNDLPKSAPTLVPGDPDKCIPYYRMSALIFHCLTPDEAETLYAQILEDVEDLVAAHKSLANLQTESETII